MFNVIRMLNMLGSEMFIASRLDNEFVGIIATKTKTGLALLLFNYIDPEIARDYLSRYLVGLHPKLARSLVKLINSNKWQEILNKEVPLGTLRLNKKVEAKIKEAITLNESAVSLSQEPQNINLNLTKLEDSYIYKKYIVDKSCCLDCAFSPREEKELKDVTNYKETLILQPYSVVLITMDRESIASDMLDSGLLTKEPDKDSVEKGGLEEGVGQANPISLPGSSEKSGKEKETRAQTQPNP